MVQQGRRLCPAVLGLKVGRSSQGQGSGSQSWKLLGLWRGALKLGLELQLLRRGTLGLGVLGDGDQLGLGGGDELLLLPP